MNLLLGVKIKFCLYFLFRTRLRFQESRVIVSMMRYLMKKMRWILQGFWRRKLNKNNNLALGFVIYGKSH